MYPDACIINSSRRSPPSGQRDTTGANDFDVGSSRLVFNLCPTSNNGPKSLAKNRSTGAVIPRAVGARICLKVFFDAPGAR